VFERFTDGARRSVVLAQEEARLLGHNYIGTEHLLLGLIREPESVAAQALRSLDVSLASARSQVGQMIGRGGEVPSGHIPFTPRAKKVLELSLREALGMTHNYIGTEHVLLGIIREGEGVGAQVLANLGADLSRVRQAVMDLLSGRTPDVLVAASGPAQWGAVSRQGPGRARLQACALCGRDLWDVERYVQSLGAAVCSECVAAAHVALQSDNTARAVTLPPRGYGQPSPPAEDLAAIGAAFRTAFELDPEAIEDSARLIPLAEQLAARNPGVRAECHVERVRLTGPDEADVRFWLFVEPMGFQLPHEGRAVRRDGRWKVARETFLQVLRQGGVTLED
jgi:Clp amino terminal domain, pathogenicity island component